MGCAVDLQHESHGCLSVAAADRKQPADLDSAGRLRAPMGACRSRTNADLGNALSVLIPCLFFGRETHASTTQSDPLLLPMRNGPYREDGALRWEYLF